MAKKRWDEEPETMLRVTPGFQLSTIDPSSTPGYDGDHRDAVRELAATGEKLAELQERLWAESKFGGRRRVLLVLQAMDTAGKGGIVRHVVGGVDPQGVKIRSFKAPSEEERAHDFLWRIRPQVPEPGIIGVFDRSHYEDVLIHRVHDLSPRDVIEERYGLITEFENELVADDTTIIKVMLHITPAEQKARLGERLERPEKHWKFSTTDLRERAYWGSYMDAYQIALERTSKDAAPWFVVPANHKWYARLAVQRILFTTLERLGPKWPKADYDVEQAKKLLAQA